VGADRSVPCGARQILVLPVRDVQVGLGVTVLLGQTKINNINLQSNWLGGVIAESHHTYLVTPLSNPHEEVVGLDITVNEVAGVDVFHARNLWRKNKRKYGDK
jgi:hypothetical protein